VSKKKRSRFWLWFWIILLILSVVAIESKISQLEKEIKHVK